MGDTQRHSYSHSPSHSHSRLHVHLLCTALHTVRYRYAMRMARCYCTDRYGTVAQQSFLPSSASGPFLSQPFSPEQIRKNPQMHHQRFIHPSSSRIADAQQASKQPDCRIAETEMPPMANPTHPSILHPSSSSLFILLSRSTHPFLLRTSSNLQASNASTRPLELIQLCLPHIYLTPSITHHIRMHAIHH